MLPTERLVVRRIVARDLYALNRVNLDHFTENFGLRFYAQYIASWPNLCVAAVGLDGSIVGYIFGKLETSDEAWHGHVTAISVASDYRGRGVVDELMQHLEDTSFKANALFVDLYVRASNTRALAMYKRRGYEIFRVLPGYYSDGEAACDLHLTPARK